MSYLFATLYALFAWWFFTAIILVLDGLPRRTFRWSLLGWTALTAVALWQMYLGRNDTSTWGHYAAFTWGTIAWGWQELSFYTGLITGPRKTPCAPDCGGFRHFLHAVSVSLYHELAVIGGCALVIFLLAGGANTTGLWTYLIMWWMHQSAKLNVFFGVRNLNEEYLPAHLRYLAAFFTKKAMNWFFPLSVSVSTAITTAMLLAAARADGTTAISITLLSVLMVLAIVEHWLLVLPINRTPWSMTRKNAPLDPVQIEVVAGFLGSGKTTFVQRLLRTKAPDERVAILVNDMGDVSLDGVLLRDRGAEVIELPNGCICCTMRGDLEVQLRAIIARAKPSRVIIEPSGAAEVTDLLRVLARPSLQPLIKTTRLYTLVDAGNFGAIYSRMTRLIEAYAEVSPLLIVNKADRAQADDLSAVMATLRQLNPQATVVAASYGVVDQTLLDSAVVQLHQADEHAPDHATPLLGLEAFTLPLPKTTAADLRALLLQLRDGNCGDVVRAKGVGPVGDGWMQADIAGGEVRLQQARPVDQPMLTVIGLNLDRAAITEAAKMLTQPRGEVRSLLEGQA